MRNSMYYLLIINQLSYYDLNNYKKNFNFHPPVWFCAHIVICNMYR